MRKVNYAVAIGALLWLLGAAQYASAANLLYSDGFESGTLSAWDNEIHGAIVSTAAARTGTYGLQYCYQCYGGGGGNNRVNFSNTKRVFLSFYRYFSPNYNFTWASGRHGFRLKSNLGSNGGQLDTGLTSDMKMQVFSECNGGTCDKYTNIGYTNTNQTGGRWYHMEVDAKWNTQGQSDGFLKLYMDGVLIKDVTGASFSNGDEYWNELWITSNDTCSGGASCTYYIDDVQIWDSNPGDGGGTTPPTGGDTTPPNISSVSTSNIGQANATITATTNEPADFQVEYGATSSYGQATNLDTSMVTSHALMIAELSANTTYHYRIKSRDAAGNLATSVDNTFITAGNVNSNGSSDECSGWQANHPEWIWCDNFESGVVSEGQGQYFEYNNNNGDFIPLSGVGLNNSYGMRARWQAGEVNAGDLKVVFGRNPIGDRGIQSTDNFRELYYRVYVRTQAGWDGDPRKLSRATVFAGSDWSQAMIAHNWGGGNGTLKIDPASCVDGSGNVVCSGYNDFNNLQWLGIKNGQTQIFSTANADTWYCVESHVKLNDPGQSNGIQEFWVDGQLDARSVNLNFVGSYTDYGLNAVFLENYWNAGSPKEQERYFDNFVISTQPIGCNTIPGLALPMPPSYVR